MGMIVGVWLPPLILAASIILLSYCSSEQIGGCELFLVLGGSWPGVEVMIISSYRHCDCII